MDIAGIYDFVVGLYGDWTTHPEHRAPALVIAFILYFVLLFIIRFLLPGISLFFSLLKMERLVGALESEDEGNRRLALARVFKGTRYQHVYKEYEESLHDQLNEPGLEPPVKRTRATVTAAYFFNEQSIVSTPIRAAFYEHIPGIITGIGIVGMFAGLMLGLEDFNANDPAKVSESIDRLLKDVYYAFIGSASAIAVSALIILLEKVILGICVWRLERLTESIDALFDAGVGEEYLSQIVRSSSDTTTQIKILNDSMVSELKAMLTNLVETQVRESTRLANSIKDSGEKSGAIIAGATADAIKESLFEPLNDIAGIVRSASGEQSGQVQTLLQDVMVAFMNRLDETFGNQFKGLHDLLMQSTSSMQAMQQNFSSLVDEMRRAGETSAAKNAEAIASIMERVEAGQASVQQAMKQMLQDLHESISHMGAQRQDIDSKLGDQISRLMEQSAQRQAAMEEQMRAFVQSISQSMGQGQKDVLSNVAASIEAIRAQFESIAIAMKADQESMRSVMSGMLDELKASIGDMGAQRQDVDNRLAEQMTRLIEQNAERQNAMESQISAFIRSINEAVGKGQAEALSNVTKSVEAMRGQFDSILEGWKQGQREAEAGAEKSRDDLEQGTKRVIDGFDQQIRELVKTIESHESEMHAILRQIADETAKTVSGLSNGARTMHEAAIRFETAGTTLGGSVDATSRLMASVKDTGSAISMAAMNLTDITSEYKANRQELERLLNGQNLLATTMQSEANLRKTYLTDLEAHSARMTSINKDMAEYLGKVSGVLTDSFKTFQQRSSDSLQQTMGKLDMELSRAVSSLSSSVGDMKESLEQFSDTLDSFKR